MDTFFRFLYEFLMQFFSGVQILLKGVVDGSKQAFNLKNYVSVVNFYKNDFNGPEWVFVVLAVVLLLLLLGLIAFMVYLIIRKLIRIRKTMVEQEELLEEVATLNDEVSTLVKEKEEILAMKVSHLGLKPGESDKEETDSKDGKGKDDAVQAGEGYRFPKLYQIDEE